MPGMGYFVASGIIALNFIVFVLPLSLYGLFFIISVELPDFEADKLANRKNLVVLLGRRNATRISILSTITATLSIIILEPLNLFARISLVPILVFSFIPFIAAFLSYIRKNAVLLNVFSMVIFIVALNLYFLTQI
jgi:4-hydroxybenzoate polyprenyltransferase